MELVYILSAGWVGTNSSGESLLGLSVSTIGWRPSVESSTTSSPTPSPTPLPVVVDAQQVVTASDIRSQNVPLFPWDNDFLEGFSYCIAAPHQDPGVPVPVPSPNLDDFRQLKTVLSEKANSIFLDLSNAAIKKLTAQSQPVNESSILQEILCRFPDQNGQTSEQAEAPEQSWSSCIAGLSQQGYPVANAMRLACSLPIAIDPTADGSAVADDTRFIAVPRFRNYDAAITPAHDADEYTIRYQPSQGVSNPGKSFVVRVLAVKYAALKDVRDFIGGAADYDASAFKNWRAQAPFRLGHYLNLYELAQPQFISTLGDSLKQGSKPVLPNGAAVAIDRSLPNYTQKQINKRPELQDQINERADLINKIAGQNGLLSNLRFGVGLLHWSAGRTFDVNPTVAVKPDATNADLKAYFAQLQDEENKLCAARLSVISQIFEQLRPMIVLANDRADLGLRQSFRTAKDSNLLGASTTGIGFEGSVAWDIISALSSTNDGGPNGVRDVLEHAMRYSGSNPNKILSIWIEAIWSTVKDLDNADEGLATGHYKDLHRLMWLYSKSYLARTPADLAKFRDDLAKSPEVADFDLIAAIDNLKQLLLSEEGLLRLFVYQWDGVLNEKDPGLSPTFLRAVGKESMSECLGGIQDFVQKSNLAFRDRFDDGLAGTFLKDAADALNAIGSASPSTSPTSSELNRRLLSEYEKLHPSPPPSSATTNAAPPPISTSPSPASLITLLEIAHAQAFLFGAIAKYIDIRNNLGAAHPKFLDPWGSSDTYTRTVVPMLQSGMWATAQVRDDLLTLEGTNLQKFFDCWAGELTGASQSIRTKWHPTPPPLLIPVNLIDGYDSAKYSGLLILSRRRRNSESPPWRVINVGELAISKSGSDEFISGKQHALEFTDELADDVRLLRKDKGLAHFGITPAPWKVVESWELPLSIIEYRGQPLCVNLWQDFGDDSTTNEGSPRSNEIYITVNGGIARWQIVQEDDAYFRGMGPVPGLRYGNEWIYEFLLIPIDNCGALPVHFQDEKGALLSASEINTWLSSLPQNDVENHSIRVSNYLRSVPLGAVRLAQTLSDDASLPESLEALRPLAKFISFKAPDAPKNVRPLALDLAKDVPADADPILASRLARPLQTLLLWEKERENISFILRPPATEIQNWTIWQSSIADNPRLGSNAISSALDCIADMEHLVHDLTRTVQHSSVEERGSVQRLLNDLLDDPAVVGVYIRIREIFPNFNSFRSDAQSAAYLPIIRPDITTYKYSPDDSGWQAKTAPYEALQKACQTTCTLTQGVSTEVNIAFSKESDQSPSLTQSNGQIKIYVPAGTIVEIEMLPCIEKAARSERFGIYDPNDVIEIAQGFAIPASATRIWAESAPLSSKENELHLDRNQVWDAITLSQLGTQARAALPTPRLEVAVSAPLCSATGWKDPTNPARRWCYVGEATAEIQPWVWRGTPEDEKWKDANSIFQSTIFSPSSDKKIQASDDFLSIATQLEIASYGERVKAASLEQSVPINFAQWYAQWSASTPLSGTPPPAIVYQDTGAQAADPKYYRVLLRLRSRYFGLGGAYAKEIESAINWDKDRRTTEFCRIGFRGSNPDRLKMPRIKMIVPLIEDSSGARPGFIVLTRDTLLSPWHQMTARLAWAQVEIGDPSEGPTTKMALPEFGPDPITAGDAFDWSSASNDSLKGSGEYPGAVFGLTFEREASSPLFPNAGVHFNAPFSNTYNNNGTDNVTNLSAFAKHDWMAKMEFRWELRPSSVTDSIPDWTSSEYTQPWQVRLLAPLQTLGKLDLKSLLFHVGPTGTDLTFYQREAVDAPVTKTSVPRPPAYDENKLDPGSSPAAALVFVVWSKVPDFLNPEESKVIHSMHFIGQTGDPIKIYTNDLAKDDLQPAGGNFLQIFGRRENLSDLQIQLLNASPKNSANEKPKRPPLDILLEDFLFPQKTSTKPSIDRDARAMIARCSSKIEPYIIPRK